MRAPISGLLVKVPKEHRHPISIMTSRVKNGYYVKVIVPDHAEFIANSIDEVLDITKDLLKKEALEEQYEIES